MNIKNYVVASVLLILSGIAMLLFWRLTLPVTMPGMTVYLPPDYRFPTAPKHNLILAFIRYNGIFIILGPVVTAIGTYLLVRARKRIKGWLDALQVPIA